MQVLNLPTREFRFKSNENTTLIFDEVRKKFVVLTPEEWVRQHVVHYLLYVKKFPLSLINVEKALLVNDMRRRYDVVVYNPNGSIRILVECKAPEVKITQSVFDQIARYDLTLQASFLMVSNGLTSYFCRINRDSGQYQFLEDLPEYVPAINDLTLKA